LEGRRRSREFLGYDDVVDKSSAAYKNGGRVGQVHNIALMLVNPAGWAGTALRGINMTSIGPRV